jgi:hypothetical protein
VQCSLLALVLGVLPLAGDPGPGVVCNVKVVSEKVADVSSLAAWKQALLREGMTDREKALAAWRTTVMFQHQDVPPREYLHSEDVVQDPIKVFNVYGYSFCSVACCDIGALARYAGLKVRGWASTATACRRSTGTAPGTCSTPRSSTTSRRPTARSPASRRSWGR